MSRKFMILMLVVFGVLLYLTSYALKKQTEPPPPLSPELQAKQKEMEEEQMRIRMEAEKARRKDAQAHGVYGEKAQKSAAQNLNLPVPPTPEPKKGPGPSDTDIRHDWFKARKGGVQGVEAEIASRKKNATPAPTPKLMTPDDARTPSGHGPGDGHNH